MKKIKIFLKQKQKQYDILIGSDLIGKIAKLCDLKKYSRVLVVTDEMVAPLFLEKLLKNLPKGSRSTVLKKGEKEKNIQNIEKILKAMFDFGCDRKSLVINLGGGVVTDMGGFAASIYMRGVDFINIPTTLLSQVDASVGGKTGIDFAGIKNLIGTFNQPKTVIIDIKTLKTLPKREFLSGFAELIKHGLIADKNYFSKVTSKKPLEFNDQELIEIISKSCEIKKRIIENDEKENSKRKLLNFGHTIGHAIEALSLETEKPLLHGEAISIGMIAETKISELVEFLSKTDVSKIANSLKNAGLPTSLRDHEVAKQSLENILKKMQSDKKNNKQTINFVLLEEIGKATIDKNVTDEIINKALMYVLKF